MKKNKKELKNEEPRISPLVEGKDLDFASTEAYNLLRSSLGFACPKEAGLGRAVGITSACPHEGKSFTSVNLALALAKAGEKVLLVDGDMRRPTVMEYVGVSLAPGLSNLLTEATSADEYASYFQEVRGCDTLTVLTAGDIPPNPSELISSDRMDAFLKKAREVFDYVIVDLPPVLVVSDAFSVSGYLEGEILLVKHKQTLHKNVVDAVRRLRLANAKILGFVYNGYSRGSGYYSKRRYYRSYGKYYQNYYGNKKGHGYGYGYGYGSHARSTHKNQSEENAK